MDQRDKLRENMVFTSFRESEDRTVKVPKSRSEIRKSCLKKDPVGTFLLEGGLKNYSERLFEMRKESVSEIKSIVEESDGAFVLLGRPEFDDGRIYQDFCTPFGEKLRDNPEDHREIIDDAVELMKECWKYGFAEATYNFTLSFGYDGEKVVVMDFDELQFDREEVLSDIEDEVWRDRRAYLWELRLIELIDFLKNPFSGRRKMKSYYEERMEEEITVENFERLWKSEV